MSIDGEVVDPIVAYAAAGRVVVFPSRDAVLRIGDMEVLYEMRERDGGFELTRRSRSEVPRMLVASADPDVIRKFLLMRICVHVRAAQRLRPIRFPGSPAALPSGFELAETDGGQELRWEVDGAPRNARFPAGSTAAAEAAAFTSVVRHDEAAIIASLEDPGGRPLFLVR